MSKLMATVEAVATIAFFVVCALCIAAGVVGLFTNGGYWPRVDPPPPPVTLALAAVTW